MNLQTDRLILRPLALDDEQILWPYVSNPAISKDMSWDFHKSISQTKEFIVNSLKSMDEGKLITWCIFENDNFCGLFSLIGILRQHRSLIYNRAELAYWIAPEFEKKGIMTEAGKKVIDFAFINLKLHKLIVGHHVENINSENLILRLGFDFKYRENEVFKKNDAWIDCKFYELNNNKYLSIKS